MPAEMSSLFSWDNSFRSGLLKSKDYLAVFLIEFLLQIVQNITLNVLNHTLTCLSFLFFFSAAYLQFVVCLD